MLLPIINDTHFGIRGDSLIFDSYFKKFYDNIFFPYLDQIGASRVIHLGDLTDRRKFINFQILNNMKKNFLEPLSSRKIITNYIAGNHDIYFRDSNHLNSLDLLLDRYDHFFVHTEPKLIYIDKLPIAIIPWIGESNYSKTIDFINSTSARIAFAHLELAGFEMDRGNINEKGLDKSLFSKFDMVLTGHFHHKSSNGNIHYLGSPTEFTWIDCDDQKGFHVLDTETLQLTRIVNPYNIFSRFIYDDVNKKSDMEKFLVAQKSNHENQFVRVIVKQKKYPKLFDAVCDKILDAKPYDLAILDDSIGISLDGNNVEIVSIEDTQKIMMDCIDNTNLPDAIKPNTLKNVFKDIYAESTSIMASL
jgi:hypothetical protein